MFRLKRDVLSRSTVGVMGTYRSHTAGGLGRNFAYGMDARFGFFEHLDIRSYAAWTQNEAETETGMSYLGQLDYNGDRYGFKTERLVVGDGSIRASGSCGGGTSSGTTPRRAFSPRPHSISWLRKIGWTGSLDYTTDNDGALETRIYSLRNDLEFENGDTFNLSATRNREVLAADFALSDALRVSAAPTTSTTPASATRRGRSARSRGTSPTSRRVLLRDPAGVGLARPGRGDAPAHPRTLPLAELDRARGG